MSYRERLQKDLDGWVAAGLVPAESREPILASVGEARRLDAATALAIIGGLLAGVAVIAFVAANWDAIPRIARFAMILAAFLAAAGAAAFAETRGRRVTRDVLLCVASLVFAAAIGLTGQIFDIAGDTQAALRGAGLAAAVLGLAAGSAWPLAIGLVFLGLGDYFGDRSLFTMIQQRAWLGWTVYAVPIGAVLALRWRSSALAHATGLSSVAAVNSIIMTQSANWAGTLMLMAVVVGGLAAVARAQRERFEGPAAVLYGWWTWLALSSYGAAGATLLQGIPHGISGLALSAGVVALGRHDRHAMVTFTGILGLLVSGAFLMFSLGMGLMTSAAIFAITAIGALVAALVMKRWRAA